MLHSSFEIKGVHLYACCFQCCIAPLKFKAYMCMLTSSVLYGFFEIQGIYLCAYFAVLHSFFEIQGVHLCSYFSELYCSFEIQVIYLYTYFIMCCIAPLKL